MDDQVGEDIESREEPSSHGSCVILMGGMGSGKSTVGWLLARHLGYGYIDLDREIEVQQGKTVAEIFDDQGEERFRTLERALLEGLVGIRSHVIAVGGGTVMDDASWQILRTMGLTVWLNAAPAEIARRLMSQEDEIKKRPLIAELMTHEDRPTRQKLLTERLSAIIGNRSSRYREAHLTIGDAFSTPESTAHLIKDTLRRGGYFPAGRGGRPLSRWSSP